MIIIGLKSRKCYEQAKAVAGDDTKKLIAEYKKISGAWKEGKAVEGRSWHIVLSTKEKPAKKAKKGKK